MKKQINIAAQQIVFTFDGLDAVTLNVAKISDEVLEYAQYHGLQARVGDNASIARKAADGSIITVTEAMRREAVLELVKHYESGTKDWGLRTGPKAAPLNPAIQRIAEKRNCSYAEAMAWFNEKLMAELEAA